MAVRKIGGSWWVDIRHRHVRYRKRSPFNTQTGAREYEVTLRAQLARGEDIDAKPPAEQKPALTLAEFAPRWLATYAAANNKASEQYSKAGILRRHLLPYFGDVRLSEISNAGVETYKNAVLAGGLKAKTVNNHLAVLRKCLRTAHEWGELESCPLMRPLKAAPPRFDYLRPNEVERLVAAAEGLEWVAMICVAVDAGLRLGELLALDWRDVDIGRRCLTVRQSVWRTVVSATKTHRVRHLPVSERTRAALATLPLRSGFVFARTDGRPASRETARKILQRACRRAGLRLIGWHVLRHTFASTLVSRGVPLYVVQQLLGHTTPTMTQRYAHLAPDVFESAIAVLDAPHCRTRLEKNGQPVGNPCTEEPIRWSLQAA